MNLILLEPEELAPGGPVTLTDRRADHIRTILAAEEGDRLRVGVVSGPQGHALVLETSSRGVVLRVDLDGEPPTRPETDLLLALPRPIILKRVLLHAAAMGIGRLFLINASRVQKSYFHSSLLRDGALASYLRQGLEQGAHTFLPEVFIADRFRPFVEDRLPGLTADCEQRLVGHPEAKRSLLEAARLPVSGRLLLAVGPEGGWIDFEIDKLEEAGFRPFTMGPRILRVDTAVPALLGQLALLRIFSPA